MREVSPSSMLVLGSRSVCELTVREYAAHERVSTRTVWTWIQKGAVSVRRTPGGSVRVQLASTTLKSSEV